mgnify:CR=1 FL=1
MYYSTSDGESERRVKENFLNVLRREDYENNSNFILQYVTYVYI